MRKSILFILIFIPVIGWAQQKDSLLEYKLKANYSEFNHFMADSMWRFKQTVAYNDPNSIDEEHWTRLFIEIKDTIAFLHKKVIDVEKDHRIGKCFFSQFSVWGPFNRDTTSVSGEVELITVTNAGVLIKYYGQ